MGVVKGGFGDELYTYHFFLICIHMSYYKYMSVVIVFLFI